MKILFGADLVPTRNTSPLYVAGDTEKLFRVGCGGASAVKDGATLCARGACGIHCAVGKSFIDNTEDNLKFFHMHSFPRTSRL